MLAPMVRVFATCSLLRLLAVALPAVADGDRVTTPLKTSLKPLTGQALVTLFTDYIAFSRPLMHPRRRRGDEGRLYLASGHFGVFISIDAGETWVSITA